MTAMRSVNRIDNEDLLRRRPPPEFDFFDGGFGGDEDAHQMGSVARYPRESVDRGVAA
jgi:hypothetical protein